MSKFCEEKAAVTVDFTLVFPKKNKCVGYKVEGGLSPEYVAVAMAQNIRA